MNLDIARTQDEMNKVKKGQIKTKVKPFEKKMTLEERLVLKNKLGDAAKA